MVDTGGGYSWRLCWLLLIAMAVLLAEAVAKDEAVAADSCGIYYCGDSG